jgi:hypothetical protein
MGPQCDIYVTLEVLRAVTMKNIIFWDVTPCNFTFTNVSEEPPASSFNAEQ